MAFVKKKKKSKEEYPFGYLIKFKVIRSQTNSFGAVKSASSNSPRRISKKNKNYNVSSPEFIDFFKSEKFRQNAINRLINDPDQNRFGFEIKLCEFDIISKQEIWEDDFKPLKL